MRSELELLKLLRERVEYWNRDDVNIGICAIVEFMASRDEINLIERARLDEFLEQNWHLSKHPMGVYKFDTMQERLDFLDMLIKKYEGLGKTDIGGWLTINSLLVENNNMILSGDYIPEPKRKPAKSSLTPKQKKSRVANKKAKKARKLNKGK